MTLSYEFLYMAKKHYICEYKCGGICLFAEIEK